MYSTHTIIQKAHRAVVAFIRSDQMMYVGDRVLNCKGTVDSSSFILLVKNGWESCNTVFNNKSFGYQGNSVIWKQIEVFTMVIMEAPIILNCIGPPIRLYKPLWHSPQYSQDISSMYPTDASRAMLWDSSLGFQRTRTTHVTKSSLSNLTRYLTMGNMDHSHIACSNPITPRLRGVDTTSPPHGLAHS